MKRLSPRWILRLISYWPPFLLAGVRVMEVDPKVLSIRVRLSLAFWNKNYFGTHFGGSLYAMCDPFFLFILADKMANDHIIWDKAASIEFVKAVREPVEAVFLISDQKIASLREKALTQFKLEPVFETEVKTLSGVVVARVSKKLYVRRKDAKTRFSKDQVVQA